MEASCEFIFFVESAADRHVHETSRISRVLAFLCARCQAVFSSPKALEQHSRIKHRDRFDIRRYVHNAICLACGTDFKEQLRCIAHMSDKRRPVCASWAKLHVQPLDGKRLLELDKADTVLRREAFKNGYSHHRARLPAVRRDGRVTGCVS